MASVTTDTKTGTRTVQFVGLDKKRHSIRLGELTSKIVNEVKGRVEQILACLQIGTAFDADLARWLSKIGSDLHGKLHASGLVQQREEDRIPKLQELCDEFLESLPHIRDSTSALMKSSLGRIASRLGAERQVTEITERDAAGFVRGM